MILLKELGVGREKIILISPPPIDEILWSEWLQAKGMSNL